MVGFMQNEVLEAGLDPRIQIFISTQFDATVTISSDFSGSYSVSVPANTVRTESIHTYHVNNASEIIQRKAIFITSDVPIVVYALNTLAQSTDSYTAIPIQHLGTAYKTVNRPSDRYAGTRYLDALPRVGEFMIMAVEDNTVVSIQTPVLTANKQTRQTVTLRRGDCYLVQAAPLSTASDDLTGSDITATKPIAVISGHVRSSVPTKSAASKDHLVEQLPPVDKWGKTYATAPMLLKQSPKAGDDVFRVVASKPGQVIRRLRAADSTFWTSQPNAMWYESSSREPALWTSNDPFLLVQCMASAGSNSGASDPAMVVVPPVEQYVNSALFQFPILEKNAVIANQPYYYYLNILATPEAVASLRVDSLLVASIAPAITYQQIPGTTLKWVQLEMKSGSHVMTSDTGLFSAIMYGTSIADSYANMVGVAYEPQRRRDISPPQYALEVDCGAVFGEVHDVSKDTAKLKDVYVVSSRTKNYRWTISPPTDSSGRTLLEAYVRDPWKDAQIVFHAYDDRGNGKEWLYNYDAPMVQAPSTILIERTGTVKACATLVIRNGDTTALHIRSTSLGGSKGITVTPLIGDTTLKPGQSIVVEVCVDGKIDSSVIKALFTLQLPCLQYPIAITVRNIGALEGSDYDFGDVRIGDTSCAQLHVVNTGVKVVEFTYLHLQSLAGELTIDTTGLNLPRMMQPGDQIWMRACYIPSNEGEDLRTDTAYSRTVGTVLLRTRGNGVRPRVQSIVVDWGLRRLGTVNDTVVYLANTGAYKCDVSSPLANLQSPFSSKNGSISAAVLPNGDSLAVALRYAPTLRGSASDSERVAVDWRLHEPVSIVLKGAGVLPEIALRDIDFGDLKLGDSKDSLATLLANGAAGNAPLHIDSVRILGPDSAAFTLPASLVSQSGNVLINALIDSVRFTPQFVGLHRCGVEVFHDASLQLPGRDTFWLFGRGLARDSAVIELALETNLSAMICRQEPVRVSLSNTGTAAMTIDSLVIILDQQQSILVDAANPVVIPPAGQWATTVSWIPQVAPTSIITAVAFDSTGKRYESTATVAVAISEVNARHGWDSTSDTGPILLQVGPHSLWIEAGVSDSLTETINPRITALVSKDRFAVDRIATSVRVDDAGRGGRVLSPGLYDLLQTDSSITLAMREPLLAPWKTSVSLVGQILWKDQVAVPTRVTVDAEPCNKAASTQPIEILVDPCGSKIRRVDFGLTPGIVIRPLGHPFRDVISVEVESSFTGVTSIYVESVDGQLFRLAERFTLQKGIQHCIFSCSGWTSGLYRLVFQHGAGTTEEKIIIVN